MEYTVILCALLSCILNAIFCSTSSALEELYHTGKHAKGIPKISIQRSTRGVYGTRINIDVFGMNYSANLTKPNSGLFASNFKLHILKENQNGQLVFIDATPSKRSMYLIQSSHFVDPINDAAVSLKQINGKTKIRGIINNISISPNELGHLATQLQFDNIYTDYIDLHRNLTESDDNDYEDSSNRAGLKTRSVVELYVIFDYDNYLAFEKNESEILDYLSVFFHGVNNRFASIVDPEISFKIVGVTIVATRQGQPYLESSRTPNGKAFDIVAAVENISRWLYTNKNTIPEFDVATVISGSQYQSKGDNGNYNYGTVGNAYFQSACWVNKKTKQYTGVSISQDMGGYYEGIWTVAHELAHNLGAPHDGILGARSCPWNSGYIMSYEGWFSPNKFKFSSCSINLMKKFINSKAGSCLRKINNINPENQLAISEDLPGDRLDAFGICKGFGKYLVSIGYRNIRIEESRPYIPSNPSDFCKNVKCIFPGFYFPMGTSKPANENTPCAVSGKCINGKCVIKEI